MYTFETFKKSVEFDAFAFDGASDTPSPVFETDTQYFIDTKQKVDYALGHKEGKEDLSVTTAHINISVAGGVVIDRY